MEEAPLGFHTQYVSSQYQISMRNGKCASKREWMFFRGPGGGHSVTVPYLYTLSLLRFCSSIALSDTGASTSSLGFRSLGFLRLLMRVPTVKTATIAIIRNGSQQLCSSST